MAQGEKACRVGTPCITELKCSDGGIELYRHYTGYQPKGINIYYPSRGTDKGSSIKSRTAKHSGRSKGEIERWR